MFKIAIPVIHISDSATAQDFYCKRLGFSLLFSFRPDETNNDPCYMTLVRDGAYLHVTSYKNGTVETSVVYLIVNAVDELYSELVAKRVPVRHPPIDQT